VIEGWELGVDNGIRIGYNICNYPVWKQPLFTIVLSG